MPTYGTIHTFHIFNIYLLMTKINVIIYIVKTKLLYTNNMHNTFKLITVSNYAEQIVIGIVRKV